MDKQLSIEPGKENIEEQCKVEMKQKRTGASDKFISVANSEV